MESFEHGLQPIPKLSASKGVRVGAAALAEELQIPTEQATLALGTLATVLPAHDDPALAADEADLRDMVLFLYIQSYKRLVPTMATFDQLQGAGVNACSQASIITKGATVKF